MATGILEETGWSPFLALALPIETTHGSIINYGGILTLAIFGGLIALVCATQGYSTKGGAKEVGKSTTQAAIISTVYMLIADFLVNLVFYII